MLTEKINFTVFLQEMFKLDTIQSRVKNLKKSFVFFKHLP